MTKNEDHERGLPLKQLIRQSIHGQIDELKDNNKGSDGSFAFLDNRTLNTLLLYLLMYLDGPDNKDGSNNNNYVVPQDFMEEIDEVTAQQKQEFEEVLTLLKNM